MGVLNRPNAADGDQFDEEEGEEASLEELQSQLAALNADAELRTTRNLKRLDIQSEHTRKLRSEWQQKWTLSLAVGNGAGLVLLGGALVKGWEPKFWLAGLPAMWMFVFG